MCTLSHKLSVWRWDIFAHVQILFVYESVYSLKLPMYDAWTIELYELGCDKYLNELFPFYKKEKKRKRKLSSKKQLLKYKFRKNTQTGITCV